MDYELKNDESVVDFNTAHYFSTKAAALAEKYGAASPGYTRYYRNKPEKQLKLLDIGCGSGRDLAEFQTAGFQVTGADVSKEILNDEGIFIFSFPIDYPGIDPDTMRDKDDRLFIIRPEVEYKSLIEQYRLKNIERELFEDSLKRSGISWAVHVYKKGAEK